MPLFDHIAPEPNPPLTRERVIRAREMYEAGFTVSRVCANCLMSLGTLYPCLDGVPFGLDGERWQPIPRRRLVTGKRRRALAADSVSLTNRLLRTAERQVRDIETRLSARAQPPVERERDVRMLVSLTRVLRDLQPQRKSKGPPAVEDDDYDNLPEDIDALRQELTDRLNAMVAAETKAPPEDI